MNLQKYESSKWEMLRKRTVDIFNAEYNAFKKQLDEAS